MVRNVVMTVSDVDYALNCLIKWRNLPCFACSLLFFALFLLAFLPWLVLAESSVEYLDAFGGEPLAHADLRDVRTFTQDSRQTFDAFHGHLVVSDVVIGTNFIPGH